MNKDSGPMRHSTKILLFCLFTAVLLLGLAESTQAQDIFSYYRGRVQEVREFIPEFTLADLGQEADVLITSGPHRGEIVTIVNHYSEQEFYLGTKIHPGQTVILAVEEIDGEIIGAYLQDIARDREIWLLTALFLLAILVVGKWKGIKTIITLGLTALVLFWVILPLLLRGYEPIPVTVFGAVVIIVFDFLIIGGLNTKSLAAIVGTTSGIAVAGTLALWAGNSANLTGFSSQEAQMLFFADPPINIRGLLFAGIIIGSLGAITDVGMSVASAASEVKKTDPSIDPLRLIRSAMNVGRDIMGTMANTLLLAYVGGATPLLLLLMSQGGGTTWTKILNLDLVATEFVRGLTGSIGLVLSIPVTAVVAGFLMSRSRHPSPGTQRGRNRANNFFRHKKTGSPF